MRLRTRILLPVVGLLLVCLGALGWFVLDRTRADLLAQVDSRLPGALDRHPLETPPASGEDTAVDRQTAFLALSPEGTVLLGERAGNGVVAYPLPDAAAVVAAARRAASRPFTVPAEGLDYRGLARLAPDGGVQVELAPLGAVDRAVSRLRSTLLAGGLLTLAALIVLIWLVLRRNLAPLTRLSEVAAAVASGERDRRVGDAGPARELTELQQSFDHMVDRLQTALAAAEASEGRMRRFVADASHELQTPITAVRAYAELHRAGALEDPAARDAAMASIAGASRRMGVLVDDLSLLAAIDSGLRFAADDVDLAGLVEDAVADASASDPDRHYLAEVTAGATVRGDADRLRQALDNLLRNVRVHTPPGTHAVVELTRPDAAARLAVSDDGPGVAPERLGRIADRFEGSGRGSGLGLAIVRSIVERSGGSMTIANADTGGLRVELVLPATAQPDAGRERNSSPSNAPERRQRSMYSK